jgi:multidrug efflux pump subunit AcrA (membrane-fusion protein)
MLPLNGKDRTSPMAPRPLRLFRARPRLATTLAVTLAVLVAGTAVGLYLVNRGTGTSPAASTTTRLVAISHGTVRASVSTTGSLSPGDEHDVSFGSAGKVTAVRVAVGDKVK